MCVEEWKTKAQLPFDVDGIVVHKQFTQHSNASYSENENEIKISAASESICFVSRKLFNHTKHMLCLNYLKRFISRVRVRSKNTENVGCVFFVYVGFNSVVWLAMSNRIVPNNFSIRHHFQFDLWSGPIGDKNKTERFSILSVVFFWRCTALH